MKMESIKLYLLHVHVCFNCHQATNFLTTHLVNLVKAIDTDSDAFALHCKPPVMNLDECVMTTLQVTMLKGQCLGGTTLSTTCSEGEVIVIESHTRQVKFASSFGTKNGTKSALDGLSFFRGLKRLLTITNLLYEAVRPHQSSQTSMIQSLAQEYHHQHLLC